MANNRLWIGLGIVLAVILIIAVWWGSTYNGLVGASETVGQKWGDVQVQYQRRAELIPNLVQVVGAFAEQERTVLTEVTNARARVGSIQISAEDAADPAKIEQFQNAQAELGGALSRLIAVAESYPELKSNENFLSLQDQLEGTENRIAVSRQDYNAVVKEYNVRVQRVPSVIVARLAGFMPRPYLEATTPGAENAPTIDRDQLVG